MKILPLIILSASLFMQACSQPADEPDIKGNTSPDVSQASATVPTQNAQPSSYPKKAFFGDTHLHTNLSADSAAYGNRLGLDAAYRFAKGEEVISSTGLKARLSRPLDFVVLADHSDAMGIFPDLISGRGAIMETPEGRKWSKMLQEGKATEVAIDIISNFSQGTLSFKTNDPGMMKPVWESVVEAAEENNDPGNFTALIGYEWTSLIQGNNLHRIVIYRDNGDKVLQQLPFTNEDSSDPEQLWKSLSSYESTTGGKVLAIPHNGNLSNGMMFMTATIAGEAFDKDYVARRAKWEPLYEVTQIKGDAEAHPFLSPDDEFANFGTWDKANLDYSQLKTHEMLRYEYARSALKQGLNIKKALGANPFKFGLIGSTDSHTSLSTADDNNYFGELTITEPSAARANRTFMKSDLGEIKTWEAPASGYAAVWAQENTRASLWDALKRKETYATTGPRMVVRFFGGWDFTAADLKGDLVQAGYRRGVPMGGDLPSSPLESPSFIVAAMQDPEGGSLDRIQIIKGWINKDGSLAEQVYDLAWSGDRKMGADGKVPLVGNTVNLERATWDNAIGAAELKAVWADPDFDPQQEAFYYARVIEIPTPRWTLYDKVRYGAELAVNIPLTTTERAYTSPIWYSP